MQENHSVWESPVQVNTISLGYFGFAFQKPQMYGLNIVQIYCTNLLQESQQDVTFPDMLSMELWFIGSMLLINYILTKH